MRTRVKCEVKTCTHWMADDICGAANIDVLNQQAGKQARTPDETECKTFCQRRGLANMLGSMDNVAWGGVAKNLVTGEGTSPTVTCTVESCRYWESGNRCVAREIQVTGANADECQDTNCQTFSERGRE
ncbi:MAG: DUF1540 domain-containing protein [Bacillota bacterium]